MNDVQINRLNSLIKSDDFLDDNATDVGVITQIPPLATDLKNKIQQITAAGAKGEIDLSGVREDKGNKRTKLEAQMLKVARGAAAYYQSASMTKELRIVDYNKSELRNKRDAQLYAASKELHAMATADVANLINVVQADVDELDTDKEAFFDVIQEPKRDEEIGKVYNAQINPLLNEGVDIRKQIDVYMQTLIADNESLYNEWAASMTIDDTGASNPPALSLTLTIEPGETSTADYSAFEMQNTSEIKLINNNDGEVNFGFGPDTSSFAGAPTTVADQSSERLTASALNYHSLDANKLNIQNNGGGAIDVVLEFYDMG